MGGGEEGRRENIRIRCWGGWGSHEKIKSQSEKKKERKGCQRIGQVNINLFKAGVASP